MKTKMFLCLFIMAVMSLSSCGNKEEKIEMPAPVPEAPKVEVYKPSHKSTTVDLSKIKAYNYFNAPTNTAATSVSVTFDEKTPYVQPVRIKYAYANGDTYEYIVPAEFGLWENEAGRLRVVTDNNNTVWLQGQTKKGKFSEFIFYGNPKYNGTKIKPNSYLNHPKGKIDYRN